MFKILKKLLKNIKVEVERLWPVLMLIFVLNYCLPHVLLAQTMEPFPELPINAGRIEIFKKYPRPSTFPEINVKQPRWTVNIWITAYNSRADQTDSTPCITASGLNVCERAVEDIIATNFNYLPFGSKVRLPELFGDKIFTVEDRMNQRYYQTADIWMENYSEARQFGRKYTVMEIL